MTQPRKTRFAALTISLAVLGGCGGMVSLGELPAVDDVEHTDARDRLLDDYTPQRGPFALKLRRGTAAVQVPAELGWCYAFFATGGDGVRDLDLVVTRPNGREVGRDTMFDVTPYVQYCADWTETVTVEVIVARGSGNATFSVLRKPD